MNKDKKKIIIIISGLSFPAFTCVIWVYFVSVDEVKQKKLNQCHSFSWTQKQNACLLLLRQHFDYALEVSRALVLQAVQGPLFPGTKTARVTRQPGQNGSTSPWDPDRPAEPHDGWAVYISWLHLWPELDYSWRLLCSPCSSALHAPLTSHSRRRPQELRHHTNKGERKKMHLPWAGGEKRLLENWFSFIPFSSSSVKWWRRW